jgi:nucleotide-binding universal stress UspA family protein
MALSLNHILFPTDFSKNAERALSFAAEIAAKTGARLTLFHASQETMDMAPNFAKSKDETIHDANTHFETLIKSLKKEERYEDLNISTILQSGQPTTSLLNKISEDKPGLVVMGTKGATGSRNAIFGSVTSNVIQKSEVPVLAVPYGSSTDKFKQIIFTTDYKEGDLLALEQTIDFARLFTSDIDILHVAEKQNLDSEIRFRGFRELVTSNIDYENINFHLKYEDDFFPGMADYLIEHETSLMVMVRYKKTFWQKLAERDHSKEMAFYSKVPLLMLLGQENSEKSLIMEGIKGKNNND